MNYFWLYVLACKVQTIGDRCSQVVIYISEIMPFYKPVYACTANSASRGYMTAESRYDSLCVLSSVYSRGVR